MHRVLAGFVIVIVAGCSTGPAVAPPPSAAITSIVTTTTSEAASTTTGQPASVDGSWSVVVVGDFGDGGEAEREVAEAMRAWVEARPGTQALVTTGDNFYTSDVNSAWEEPYGWVDATGLQLWPVPGNHDIESPGQFQASVTAFGSFPRWRTRDIGGVTFVLLDSNQVRSTEQRAWLERTTALLGDRPWIAVFHHPWWSCGAHGSEAIVDEMWGDVLPGAVLVLNGHDHTYQRFESESGWSVVTGGGGRGLHPMTVCPEGTASPAMSVEQHHFLAITGEPGGLLVEVVGVDGGRIDAFRVRLPG